MNTKIKIALLGFGNMGQEVNRLCETSDDFEVVSISCKSPAEGLDLAGIALSDVVIDFTAAEVVVKNVEEVTKLGKHMVIGATGWYEHADAVKELARVHGVGVVYGKNFSIGANIFFQITAYAARLFAHFPDYDVYGFEMHHSGKRDSPSGTALKIADEILKNFLSKKTVCTEKLDRKIDQSELHFASVRGGKNPGFHEVIFESVADTVTLSHQAHNRAGFAEGALVAAKFITNKKGWYSFEDIFNNKNNV